MLKDFQLQDLVRLYRCGETLLAVSKDPCVMVDNTYVGTKQQRFFAMGTGGFYLDEIPLSLFEIIDVDEGFLVEKYLSNPNPIHKSDVVILPPKGEQKTCEEYLLNKYFPETLKSITRLLK